jgi:hypothetical protein
MLLAFILIIISFIGTWYTFSWKFDDPTGLIGETDVEAKLGLKEGKISGKIFGVDIPKKDTKLEYIESIDGKPAFDGTLYLTIIAIFTSIISILGILGTYIGSGRTNRMKKIGSIFGVITFIFLILAPIYFMTAFNIGIMRKFTEGSVLGTDIGFWFNAKILGNEFSIGPGYAWYLIIFAGILALIGSIPMIKKTN